MRNWDDRTLQDLAQGQHPSVQALVLSGVVNSIAMHELPWVRVDEAYRGGHDYPVWERDSP